MQFLIAPDKFKGALTGQQFCLAVMEGIQLAWPEASCLALPLADGGDGSMEAVRPYFEGQQMCVTVQDPLGKDIEATYLYDAEGTRAFIELSKASGYDLLSPNQRNCMHTTSYGTGQLISHAYAQGAREIILAIGGSATNDAAMGIAAALGYRFLDGMGKELAPVGKHLGAVQGIDATGVTNHWEDVRFRIACDVRNPFYGPDGAARVYAPQKGASPKEVKQLDEGLAHFSEVLHRTFGVQVQDIPGAGAAGGIGGGMMAFFKAELLKGVDIMMELAHFHKALRQADWVITGEGSLDEQTGYGKTISGVLDVCHQNDVPVAAFCGSVHLSPEAQQRAGFGYVASVLNTVVPLAEALDKSYDNVRATAYNFARLLRP